METSWALYRIGSRSASTSVCTERRSVYGGITATSVRVKSCFLSARIQASFWTSATASGWVTFIFQLPAIRGVREAIYVLLSASREVSGGLGSVGASVG